MQSPVMHAYIIRYIGQEESTWVLDLEQLRTGRVHGFPIHRIWKNIWKTVAGRGLQRTEKNRDCNTEKPDGRVYVSGAEDDPGRFNPGV